MNNDRTRFSLVSLGCPKNLVDSEMMVGKLLAAGHAFDEQLTRKTQCVILNTCGFLAAARDEARTQIASLMKWKRESAARRVIVTGCFVTYDSQKINLQVAESLAAEFPEVDAWLEVNSKNKINEVFAQVMARDTKIIAKEKSVSEKNPARHLLTLPHVAYLRIADGCNRKCAFCLIPNIRGKFVSKPIEALVDEAELLAARGVKELILVAQETTFYGIDLYGRTRLAELLTRLENVRGIEWIRLMYTYPAFFDDEIFALLAARGKLLPYIDMPLQHASDVILQRMKRATDKKNTEKLLEKLRHTRDDLVLRTSLIVGFPDETKEQFQELINFVERWKFERLGIFPFSPEIGTTAATFPGQLPAEKIARRVKRLTSIQEKLSAAARTRQIGTRVKVIIDSAALDEDGNAAEDFFVGRTFADAPDIDPVVYVTGKGKVGEMVLCEMVAAQNADGIAVIIE